MASVHPPPDQRPVVLVVEDEPLLQMMAADLVEEEADCEAIVVGDAEEAWQILENREDIRVVFADINLPGRMDGLKLAALIRRRWPPLGLILTSGMVRPGPGHLPERTQFFPKPYVLKDVAAALRALV
jgi:CheY-like chemotaxis protein